METIIKISHPFKRVELSRSTMDELGYSALKRLRKRICRKTKGSIGEFGGSRTNTRHSIFLFGYKVMEIHRNEYHDKSDAERADEYLKQWSTCEKELRRYRLMVLGEKLAPEVKKVIKDAFSVDFDKEQ
jgi:hypothetical protein